MEKLLQDDRHREQDKPEMPDAASSPSVQGEHDRVFFVKMIEYLQVPCDVDDGLFR